MEHGYECNAIVESAQVRLDRDFILSVWLMLKYDGAGQGFGGYVLGGTSGKAGEHHNQKNICAEWLVWCLKVCDVDDFAKCVGKVIRVRKKDEWGDIVAIGHPVKDVWFYPKQAIGDLCK